jgi:hypothetical protein
MSYCLRCDFVDCQHCYPFTKALFRTIPLISRVTQFSAALHAGSLVSCHNFLSFLLCFNKRSEPGISYFRSKIVVVVIDVVYVEVVEAAKAALSEPSEE